MNEKIIVVTLKNGTSLNGSILAVLPWLAQQTGCSPEQILPATIGISDFETAEQAAAGGRQWIELDGDRRPGLLSPLPFGGLSSGDTNKNDDMKTYRLNGMTVRAASAHEAARLLGVLISSASKPGQAMCRLPDGQLRLMTWEESPSVNWPSRAYPRAVCGLRYAH